MARTPRLCHSTRLCAGAYAMTAATAAPTTAPPRWARQSTRGEESG